MQYIDNEFNFFEICLKQYANCTEETIKADEELTKFFNNLVFEYNISKDKVATERNEVEQLADSFMFYRSNNVIFAKNGVFYINVNKVKEINEKYQNAISNEDNIVYKKGTRK